MAIITIVSGANVGRSHQLGDREMTIGREPLCEIVLPVRTVSRRHARIGCDVDGYYVEDLGSVNGTYVNGQALEGRTRLEHEDRIRISQNVLQFFDQAADDETVMFSAATLRTLGSSTDEPADASESHMQQILSTLDAASSSDFSIDVNPLAKLRAVLEITQSLGSSLQLDDVLPRILDSLFRIFPQADHGYILQAPRMGAPLEPIAIEHRNSDSDTISPIGGPIVARVMSEGAAFLSATADDDPNSVLEETQQSVMCAPLMGPAKTPLGVIHLDTNNAAQPFTQSDLEVLVAVATVAGQGVEYARMHADILELDRQNRDLSTAKDVQLHFLPQQPPSVHGYGFFHYYRAASTVAGDYYDYVQLPDGRLAVTMGDVSGKGVPAALLMARLCSDVRFMLLTKESPAGAVNALNRQLVEHLRPGRFITFVLFVIDPIRHRMSIVNAGHTPPLLRRERESEITALAGGDQAEIPLGIKADVHYPQTDLDILPGDVILAYTDGVNEALNEQGQLYGTPRVRDIMSVSPHDPGHVGQALVSDVRRFASGLKQSDDICLVCFGREKE